MSMLHRSTQCQCFSRRMNARLWAWFAAQISTPCFDDCKSPHVWTDLDTVFRVPQVTEVAALCNLTNPLRLRSDNWWAVFQCLKAHFADSRTRALLTRLWHDLTNIQELLCRLGRVHFARSICWRYRGWCFTCHTVHGAFSMKRETIAASALSIKNVDCTAATHLRRTIHICSPWTYAHSKSKSMSRSVYGENYPAAQHKSN